MSGLMTLLKSLAIEKILSVGFSTDHARIPEKCLTAFSGILLAMGVGLFVYGFYLWASAAYLPYQAMLMTAGLFFVFFVLTIGLILCILSYKQKKVNNIYHGSIDAFFAKIEDLAPDIKEQISNNPLAAAGIAMALGFVAGKKY